MNSRKYFHFDFSIPNRIAWKWCGQDKELGIPEEPVLFQIDDDSPARGLMSAVEPLLADLVNVAVSIHLADRLALKECFINDKLVRCHRLINLRIAVDDCRLWRDEQILQRLRRVLGFLSQDTWSFDFVQRRERRQSEAQQLLFSASNLSNAEVALFSGGLDSLAGSANQMARCAERPFIAVSASPSNIHLGRQSKQFKAVKNAFSLKGTHVVFKYCMRGASKSLQEPSRRTRGFVFLVLGAVTALTAGVKRLTVHENGFGAVNLPYDSSQLGVDLTRAMHPTNLQNFSELISFITGQPFAIRNDSIFMSKAEMCKTAATQVVAGVIKDTFSCDGLTRTGYHCGYCTSCLLRRLALESAGLQTLDHGKYLNDLTDRAFHPKLHQLWGLRAMAWQAARLRSCLKGLNSWSSLLSEFPEIQLAAADLTSESEDVPQELCRLYNQHVEEWFRFSALHHFQGRLAA
ncbi:MAG TPA: 7-cyano-7-deazaguanine synthase [Candidatus Angelobacter sp.]|jgi:7-cyano-7-deazaguanine synthase in queuosine biosynthesis